MTLTQLRTFLAVAETGSVRAAAERLVVTQPAVSMAVAALERSLGVVLTVRDGRGLRLSPAGQTFADYARQVLALLEAGAEAAVGGDAPERGRLRLGAVTTAAENVLPAFLAGFRHRYPEVRIQLEVGNRSRVWDLLGHHEVDIVVAGRPPEQEPFVVRARRENALVLVSAPDRTLVDRDELGRETWLLREPGSGTRRAVEDLLNHLGIDPPTFTLGSNGAIRESVQAGLGVSVLSRDAVADQIERATLREWDLSPFPVTRPWHVVTRSDRPIPATASLFVEHLIADHTGAGGPFIPVKAPSRPRRSAPDG
jgi:LysR family transcriptional regulator, low CO2-responsive transcriptional regulator